ncbi:MAG: hypothetical protein RL026_2013 [Pseudomonadota bacterium]
MSGWLLHHMQALLFAAGRLVRAPFATFLTAMVIGIALALPAGFALGVGAARSAGGEFANAVDITAYFRQGVDLRRVEELASSVRARGGVDTLRVIPADEALEQFRADPQFGSAIRALGENPLPHALELRPAVGSAGPAEVESLRQYLSAWPEVELVQIDSDWVQRLDAILDLLRRVVSGVAVLLGVGVVAVVGNTIRLEILNRREEIEITKLVGGSDAFVRRPFLYTGALYGLLGALFAALWVWSGYRLLAPPLQRLADFYAGQWVLPPLGVMTLLQLLLAGVALGWLGAWVATGRHISAIEPRA